MRTFKISTLSKSEIFSTVLVTIVTVLYITSPWHNYFITGILYLLTSFTHLSHPGTLPLPLTITNLFSVSINLILLFKFHIQVRSYSICLSLTYFTWHMPSSFIRVIVNGKISSRFHSLYVCVYKVTSLSVHSSTDT